jgi:hypothetical protein
MPSFIQSKISTSSYWHPLRGNPGATPILARNRHYSSFSMDLRLNQLIAVRQ